MRSEARAVLRGAEVAVSFVMATFSIYVLTHPLSAMDTPAYSALLDLAPPPVWGLLGLFGALFHAAAIWVNGRDLRWTPPVRLAACGGGFLYFSTLSLGFAASGDSTGVATYGALALIYLLGVTVAAWRSTISFREMAHAKRCR